MKLSIRSLLGSYIYPRWNRNEIPRGEFFLRRVHFTYVNQKSKRPSPSVFKDVELSCDWMRYSTPLKSLEIIGKEYKFNKKEYKNKDEFFICSFKIDDVLDIQTQVKHDPVQFFPSIKGRPNNRSHSLVISDDDKLNVKMRSLLAKVCVWEIFDEKRLDILKS